MLLDNFYSVIEQGETIDANIPKEIPVRKFHVLIKLDPNHAVYLGHFPGNPVVPGVCQVQIIKELAESILKTDLVINKSDNIKFLSMIVPTVTPLLNISIEIKEKETGSWQVNSIISGEEQVFLKFRGIMRSV
jgi:3-hydroxyacyl-[acyl-carrier-protein] dehydratase